jgi:hypothetical protein
MPEPPGLAGDAPAPAPPEEGAGRSGGPLGLVRRWMAMLATAVVAGGLVGLLVPAPSGVRQWQLAVVCALAGALGALGLALTFERTGGGLRGAHDAAALTGARALGVLGREAWRAAPSPAIVTADGGSSAADDYRLLAGKLQAAGARSVALLRVDAPAPGLGAQLAAALADRGERVALIDPARGTATLLAPPERPTLLPTTEPAHVVDVAGAKRVLEDVLGVSDVALVDLPSLQRPASAVVWASAVDGAVLAVQVGRTTRSGLAAVTDSLRRAQVPLVGTVLGAPGRLGRSRS